MVAVIHGVGDDRQASMLRVASADVDGDAKELMVADESKARYWLTVERS